MTNRPTREPRAWNKPLEQDWPGGGQNVKVVRDPAPEAPPQETALTHSQERKHAKMSTPTPESTQELILTQADRHLSQAVDHLHFGLAWFKVTDPSQDHAKLEQMLRELAETVAYRKSLLDEA